MVKYDYDNTCMLSVYGSPVWDMYCGEKLTEERSYKLLSFQHVIVVCANTEDHAYKIPPAQVDMKPGSAYLVFTVGGYGKGTFKPIAWILKNIVTLDTPFPLGNGEKPKQGPTPLNCKKPGHVKLLALLNGQVGVQCCSGHYISFILITVFLTIFLSTLSLSLSTILSFPRGCSTTTSTNSRT
jgi:hypothetical protein